ncbi:hypothetical protein PGT21_022777 [Puccinia graminis f. sp. tritici]|uniref:Uncharacterized protein n=1 Tax=Puccinia graminis f. sp. tritici TaxID=56615 RepID=A0A5B0LY99_PUCGR|nr:hypothetical protein PGT21_022777 [Puccinia graminis f. sp. tritici]
MQVYLLSSFILISLFLVQIGSVEYTDEKKILDPVLNGSPAFVDHTPESSSHFGKILIPKDHHESYLHFVTNQLHIASSRGLDFLVYDADEKRLSYIGKTLKSFIDILFKDVEKKHITNKDIASSFVRQALNLIFSGIFFHGAIRELHSASQTIKEKQLFESSFLTLKIFSQIRKNGMVISIPGETVHKL